MRTVRVLLVALVAVMLTSVGAPTAATAGQTSNDHPTRVGQPAYAERDASVQTTEDEGDIAPGSHPGLGNGAGKESGAVVLSTTGAAGDGLATLWISAALVLIGKALISVGRTPREARAARARTR